MSPKDRSGKRSIRSRHDSSPSEYTFPDAYENLDELRVGGPVDVDDESPIRRRRSTIDGDIPLSELTRKNSARTRRHSATYTVDYDVPDSWANLDELITTSPIENPDERPVYRHRSLEEARSKERDYEEEERRQRQQHPDADAEAAPETGASAAPGGEHKVSAFNTKLYTHSYLVFFSILGTLAREGLPALNTYPGTPLIFDSIWPNFVGCVIMGFLVEDRMLFRHEWGTPRLPRRGVEDAESGGSSSDEAQKDLTEAKKSHMATKKTIPLFIGLTTGLCGSLTTFSSFVLDSFLALSNGLVSPDATASTRDAGYSVLALLAVILTTLSLSLCGLFLGAHLAIFLEPITPSLPYRITRKILDRVTVVLGWGSWIGAIILCAFPPHDVWRGRVLISLPFAPMAVFLRFYLAIGLNSKVASFPLGTFAANVFGTLILGLVYALSHVPVGGILGCQVLYGVQQGFCGCLTTVSTLVVELSSLRRSHAYVYGSVSYFLSFGLLIIIIGSLKWTRGLSDMVCSI